MCVNGPPCFARFQMWTARSCSPTPIGNWQREGSEGRDITTWSVIFIKWTYTSLYYETVEKARGIGTQLKLFYFNVTEAKSESQTGVVRGGDVLEALRIRSLQFLPSKQCTSIGGRTRQQPLHLQLCTSRQTYRSSCRYYPRRMLQVAERFVASCSNREGESPSGQCTLAM